MSREEFLWSEKYRPKTIDECILPESLKIPFKNFVAQKNVPNLLLTGRAGTGKTTVARAMLDEIGANYTMVNGSLEGNIDNLRTKIMNFASSLSFKGGRKYVILDEADYLTHFTQPALRNFMEEFSVNCGFILTANYDKRIIPELHSRCAVIDFSIDKSEAPKMASLFYKRVLDILKKEKVEYESKAVVDLIQKHYPDWRRVLNELQYYASQGKIDQGVLQLRSLQLTELLDAMRSKNFTVVRKWIAENLNNDQDRIYREFYDSAVVLFEPSYVPELVMILAKYLYQSNFSTDPEINFAAAMVEVMMTAHWK